MDFNFEHYFVIALLLVFFLKKVLAKQVTMVADNEHLLNLCFFFLLAIFLGLQFWQDGMYAGIFAIFLGSLAIGKYYYDVSE